MRTIDFTTVIVQAWADYAPGRRIFSIVDISARVSTNHVYKITLNDGFVIAKLSYFGRYEHFVEDHNIIHQLGSLLPSPYENFLASSYTHKDKVFTYRSRDELKDVWVVFYHPVEVVDKLPRRLDERHIRALGKELACFHLACAEAAPGLQPSSKTLDSDIVSLLKRLDTEEGQFEHGLHLDIIREQCNLFLRNTEKLRYKKDFDKIPVFVDWNIGNFSVTRDLRFYSRWDYDWFRMSSRVMDFYFFSRVVSDVGDRTIFSYVVDPLMEDRFMIFLKEYHAIYPLTEEEVLFIKEAYRFFILNYVIKDGKYFFHDMYATRLQYLAYSEYFPQLDARFDAGRILKALNI